jgi:DNA-binding transcriptional LysR family regulator
LYTFINNELFRIKHSLNKKGVSMELSDLTIFCKVIESGGISAAAQQLNRVPSNITSRIQKLETELDKSLFIREKNRLRASPAGEQLFGYAKKILSMAEQALDELNQNIPSGALRLGSVEAVAASRLSNVLMNFHQQYNAVDLELTINPTGDLLEKVLAGQLDLALISEPVNDVRLAVQPIFQETLVLVSALRDERITSPADLGGNPTIVGFSKQCIYRTRLAQWLKEAEVMPKIVEINSYFALLNCITAGMGVGLVPEKLLDCYPFANDLKVHTLPQKISQTTTCLIWRKDSVKPSMTAFKELLMQVSNINSK